MRRFFLVSVIVAIGFAGPVCGDGGLIPFVRNVQVFEPNQNALIAWNGYEEILILSTDTYASTPTKALEVVPFKSEPSVKKGDPRIFEKATALINARFRQPRGVPGALAAGGPAPAAAAPAGEVTQHKQIGRHDISVTHVLDTQGFCNWAEDFLHSKGADAPQVPEAIRSAVQEYIATGFTWFVYDVLELGTKVSTNEPVQFRFKSDCLFYPLAITRTESQQMNVRLLIITAGYLTQYLGLPRNHIRVGLEQYPDPSRIAEEMVILTRSQLNELSPYVADVFGHQDGMRLRIWTLIPEDRNRFHHDLIAR